MCQTIAARLLGAESQATGGYLQAPALLQSETDGSTLDSPYHGYGGWLALFCAAQLFIAPIVAVILTIIEAHTFWEFGPLLAGERSIGYVPALSAVAARYPGLMAASVLESLGTITVVGLGMYAAIRLRGIRPGAVRSARCYMLAALAWSVIAFALPFIGNFPDGGQEAMIPCAARGLRPHVDPVCGLVHLLQRLEACEGHIRGGGVTSPTAAADQR